MFTFLLQDRVTLIIDSSTTSEVQAESGWLDLQGYTDVATWTEFTEISTGGASSLLLYYETSPSLEDAQFRAMVTVSVPYATVGQVTMSRVLAYTASTPLARYVRWRVEKVGAVTARFTFRTYVSANCVDRRLLGAAGAT